MKTIGRNILAVLAGLVLGSVVNMSLIMVSGSVIPPPDGADVTTMEGLLAAMPNFEAKHFIFPFLAHALGTLVGAFIAAKIAVNRKMIFALSIGLLFMLGGISMAMELPAPMSFEVLDILGAYLPMAWIGAKLAGVKKNN